MVNNLLETYELEDGRVKLVLESVDLSRLISDCCEDLQPLAMSKGISLTNDTNSQPVWLMADPLLLKRLINNLLGNAIANIPANETITVYADADGEFINLIIQDTGQGISEELLPHLFTRHFSGRITKRKIGSGLGLYICKMIVDLHGGSIEVSTKNEHIQHGPDSDRISRHGTLFHVRLPIQNR